MVLRERDLNTCQAHPGNLQYGGRCRVRDATGAQQLEIEALDLCCTPTDLGTVRCGFVCRPAQQTNNFPGSTDPEAEAVDAVTQNSRQLHWHTLFDFDNNIWLALNL